MNGGIRSNMQWKRVGSCASALALMMTVGVQPALAAATPYRLSVPSGYVSSFSDVQEDDWYYDYVAVLNSRGMIDGYGNGLFGANDPLTSGAALVMVLKAAGSGDLARRAAGILPRPEITGPAVMRTTRCPRVI